MNAIGIVILFVVLLGIGAGVAVYLSIKHKKGKSKDDPTPDPTSPPPNDAPCLSDLDGVTLPSGACTDVSSNTGIQAFIAAVSGADSDTSSWLSGSSCTVDCTAFLAQVESYCADKSCVSTIPPYPTGQGNIATSNWWCSDYTPAVVNNDLYNTALPAAIAPGATDAEKAYATLLCSASQCILKQGAGCSSVAS